VDAAHLPTARIAEIAQHNLPFISSELTHMENCRGCVEAFGHAVRERVRRRLEEASKERKRAGTR
jgi:hypothetical protein